LNSLREIWLADFTYTQQGISADLIPAAIGGIALFSERKLSLQRQIRLFKYPELLADQLSGGIFPDVFGFSCYILNTALSYGFATRIKQLSPNTLVVFGGPDFPLDKYSQKAWLDKYPAIDFYIEKETELAFAELLRRFQEADGDSLRIGGSVPSVYSLPPSGELTYLPTQDRIRDLDEIPSPYLEGRLDSFFDGKLLPIIQTNRGCPFTCTFCVEDTTYYNKIASHNEDRISAEIEYIGRLMSKTRGERGIGRMFTKAHVKKLLRTPRRLEQFYAGRSQELVGTTPVKTVVQT
jgi:hypothetical protein